MAVLSTHDFFLIFAIIDLQKLVQLPTYRVRRVCSKFRKKFILGLISHIKVKFFI